MHMFVFGGRWDLVAGDGAACRLHTFLLLYPPSLFQKGVLLPSGVGKGLCSEQVPFNFASRPGKSKTQTGRPTLNM